MARPKRIRTPDTTYHVYSRCHNCDSLMVKAVAKELMESIIIMALAKYCFHIVFYEILDDHFHFVIKTTVTGPDISRIMQFIKSLYARKINKILNRKGAFWCERFKDVIIEEQESPESYLMWLFWFIAYNPVRRGLIADPRHYRFGSINAYLDETNIQLGFITQHDYFVNLGKSLKERIFSFLKYEERYLKRIIPIPI